MEDFFIRQNDFALVRIKNDRFTFERLERKPTVMVVRDRFLFDKLQNKVVR